MLSTKYPDFTAERSYPFLAQPFTRCVGVAILLLSISFYKAENFQRAARSHYFQEKIMILICVLLRMRGEGHGSFNRCNKQSQKCLIDRVLDMGVCLKSGEDDQQTEIAEGNV